MQEIAHLETALIDGGGVHLAAFRRIFGHSDALPW
jgi:hypothetical protein